MSERERKKERESENAERQINAHSDRRRTAEMLN